MRRSATLFFRAQSNNNALTSFDTQDIASELLSSSKAYHGAPAKQLHSQPPPHSHLGSRGGVSFPGVVAHHLGLFQGW
jgi:hypothetical protein